MCQDEDDAPSSRDKEKEATKEETKAPPAKASSAPAKASIAPSGTPTKVQELVNVCLSFSLSEVPALACPCTCAHLGSKNMSSVPLRNCPVKVKEEKSVDKAADAAPTFADKRWVNPKLAAAAGGAAVAGGAGGVVKAAEAEGSSRESKGTPNQGKGPGVCVLYGYIAYTC